VKRSRSWFIAAAFLLLTSVDASAAETVVSGTIHAARADGSAVRLDFEDPSTPPVILLVGWLSNFPPAPEQYYLGKSISVRGSLRSFRGASEVHVRDAAEITVLSAVSPRDSSPPTLGEVDKLREQVRTLQQRVQELERGRENGGRSE
jgi:hypothetical protein